MNDVEKASGSTREKPLNQLEAGQASNRDLTPVGGVDSEEGGEPFRRSQSGIPGSKTGTEDTGSKDRRRRPCRLITSIPLTCVKSSAIDARTCHSGSKIEM